MNGTWEIAGEIGAELGPARLPLTALFPLVQDLVFSSQAADTWGYFLPINDDGSNSEYLPARQQTISLFRDGVREFCGRVVSRKYIFNSTGQGWQIQVKGGWYELEKVPLISDTAATYDIAPANIADSLRVILQKAITDGGARLQIGDISAMMDCFALQFRSATVAATVRDLLRFAQDAFTFVDYQSEGLPTLHISRRSTASARTIVLGTESVTRCELSPNDDAAPDRVDFIYALADSNGIVSQITESAGSASPSNRLQVVTAATGFEEFQTRAAATEVLMETTTTASWAYAYAADPKLKDIVGLPDPFTSGSYSRPTGGTYTTKGSVSVAGTTPAFSGFTAPNNHAIVTGEVKDFMVTKLGITKGVCNFAGHFWWKYQLEDASGDIDPPDWAAALMGAGGYLLYGWWTTGTGGLNDQSNSNTWSAAYIRLYVEFEGVAISRDFTSSTAVRDPGDYSLVAPPTGIAPFLLAAMTDPPYDGQADFDSFQSYERGLGRVHNVSGGPDELLTAKATPKQERISIQTGVRSVAFGSSAAGSGLDLMSRFRRVSAK